MNQLYRNNYKTFLLLFSFWIIWEIMNIIPGIIYSGFSSKTILDFFEQVAKNAILQFTLFYAFAYAVIPRYLQHRKINRLIIYTVSMLLLYGLVKLSVAVVTKDALLEGMIKTTPLKNPRLTYFFLRAYEGITPLILAVAYRFTINWRIIEKRQLLLQKEKLEAQLSFLRSQINAHFLFNTLNNIYSLSLKKSDATSGVILKLSEMMRYMLYERIDLNNKVELEKEISYLNHYIELQKLQNGGDLCAEISIEGDVASHRIAPLLLVPFVENAFKHGQLSNPANPVRIILVVEKNRLLFKVSNAKHLQNKDRHGGIGLENVQRRLQLEYEGKHELTINDHAGNYSVQLTLLLE